METRKGGFAEWKRTHACEVGISKDGLLQFAPRGRKDVDDPLIIDDMEIKPAEQVKYLA